MKVKPSKCFVVFLGASGEVESFCADLGGRLNINTVVRMSVDKLHDLLFSADTHFIQHLFSQRHFTGTSAALRERENGDASQGCVRNYKALLKHVFSSSVLEPVA